MTGDIGLGFRVCNKLLRGLNYLSTKKIAIDIESKVKEGTTFIINFADMMPGTRLSTYNITDQKSDVWYSSFIETSTKKFQSGLSPV